MMKMRITTLYLSVSLLPIVAFADSFSFQKEWRTCESNAECTITRDVCGNADAVNRKYEKDAVVFMRENAPRVNCSDGGAVDLTIFTAQCAKGNCGVVHDRD
jgi:hypothetical protein